MYEHQCVYTSPGNHRSSSNCFAKGRRRTQDTCIVLQHGGYGGFLIQT